MAMQIDLAVSAPKGNSIDLDTNYVNSVVLTGLRITDALGNPRGGPWRTTQASAGNEVT